MGLVTYNQITLLLTNYSYRLSSSLQTSFCSSTYNDFFLQTYTSAFYSSYLYYIYPLCQLFLYFR